MPVFQLTQDLIFPPPELARDDGLLAVGGDLSTERLLLAYSMGIFPWYSERDPILWWAPSPRLILEPKEFRISRRLARQIRQKKFNISFDSAFREVITECARIRYDKDEKTWIVNEMIEAYCRLHELGYAHSVECRLKGDLVGGLYGIALGTIFFGESMFSRLPNTSKIAMAALVQRLKGWDYDMIDCQVGTEHLVRLGAKEIPGEEFYRRLALCVDTLPQQERWKT